MSLALSVKSLAAEELCPAIGFGPRTFSYRLQQKPRRVRSFIGKREKYLTGLVLHARQFPKTLKKYLRNKYFHTYFIHINQEGSNLSVALFFQPTVFPGTRSDGYTRSLPKMPGAGIYEPINGLVRQLRYDPQLLERTL